VQSPSVSGLLPTACIFRSFRTYPLSTMTWRNFIHAVRRSLQTASSRASGGDSTAITLLHKISARMSAKAPPEIT
jgi:hypothetical protein